MNSLVNRGRLLLALGVVLSGCGGAGNEASFRPKSGYLIAQGVSLTQPQSIWVSSDTERLVGFSGQLSGSIFAWLALEDPTFVPLTDSYGIKVYGISRKGDKVWVSNPEVALLSNGKYFLYPGQATGAATTDDAGSKLLVNDAVGQMVIWDGSNTTKIPPPSDGRKVFATCASDDLKVIYGTIGSANSTETFRWSLQDGYTTLKTPDGRTLWPQKCSANGQSVAGQLDNQERGEIAVLNASGVQIIPDPNHSFPVVSFVSNDGAQMLYRTGATDGKIWSPIRGPESIQTYLLSTKIGDSMKNFGPMVGLSLDPMGVKLIVLATSDNKPQRLIRIYL